MSQTTEGPGPTLGQVAWRRFCRLMTRIFYSRHEVAGLENVPRTGPVLFCANHVNALVDAVVVQASLERPVHPLARSGLFRNLLLRPILGTIQAVPVYRRRPGSETQTQQGNQDSFERCYDYLAEGRALLIFPEGQSHSDPSLRPLKTGAARLAYGLAERTGTPPTVIPVGLTFPQKGRFRSELLVQFGEPLQVDGDRQDGGPDGEAKAGETQASETQVRETQVRAWTAALGEGLASVTLNVDSWEDLELLQLLHDFFDLRGRGRRQSLAQRFRSLQWLIETHRWLRLTQPVQVRLVTERLRHFASLCRRHGVEDYHLNLRYRPALVARFVLRSLAFVLFVLPLGVWGFLNSALPYYATRAMSWLSARGRDQYDTAGMLFGTVFFLAFWGAQSFAVFQEWGRNAALLYAASLPVTAGIALKLGQERRRIVENVRVFLVFLRRKRLQHYLRAKRDELEVDIARLARLARGEATGVL